MLKAAIDTIKRTRQKRAALRRLDRQAVWAVEQIEKIHAYRFRSPLLARIELRYAMKRMQLEALPVCYFRPDVPELDMVRVYADFATATPVTGPDRYARFHKECS